jgi:hypothetical protein
MAAALAVQMYTVTVGPVGTLVACNFSSIFGGGRTPPPPGTGGVPAWYRMNSLTAYRMEASNKHPFERVAQPLAVDGDSWVIRGQSDSLKAGAGEWTKISLHMECAHSPDVRCAPGAAYAELFRNGSIVVKSHPTNPHDDPQASSSAIVSLALNFFSPCLPSPTNYSPPKITFLTLMDSLPCTLAEYAFCIPATQDFICNELKDLGMSTQFFHSGSSHGESRLKSFQLQNADSRFVVWTEGKVVVTTPMKGGVMQSTATLQATCDRIKQAVRKALDQGAVSARRAPPGGAGPKDSLSGSNLPKLNGRGFGKHTSAELAESLKLLQVPMCPAPEGMVWRNHAKKLWMYTQLCKAAGVPCPEPDPSVYFREMYSKGKRKREDNEDIQDIQEAVPTGDIQEEGDIQEAVPVDYVLMTLDDTA